MKVRGNISKVYFLTLLFVFSTNASAGNLPCVNNSHLHQDKSIDSTPTPQNDLIDADKSTLSKSKIKSNTKHLGVFKLLIPNTLR